MADAKTNRDALAFVDSIFLSIRDITFAVEVHSIEMGHLHSVAQELSKKSEDFKSEGHPLYVTLPIDEKVDRYTADAAELLKLINEREKLIDTITVKTWDSLAAFGFTQPDGVKPAAALRDLRKALISEIDGDDAILGSDHLN